MSPMITLIQWVTVSQQRNLQLLLQLFHLELQLDVVSCPMSASKTVLHEWYTKGHFFWHWFNLIFRLWQSFKENKSYQWATNRGEQFELATDIWDIPVGEWISLDGWGWGEGVPEPHVWRSCYIWSVCAYSSPLLCWVSNNIWIFLSSETDSRIAVV